MIGKMIRATSPQNRPRLNEVEPGREVGNIAGRESIERLGIDPACP
jgi:hypothetical protein